MELKEKVINVLKEAFEQCGFSDNRAGGFCVSEFLSERLLERLIIMPDKVSLLEYGADDLYRWALSVVCDPCDWNPRIQIDERERLNKMLDDLHWAIKLRYKGFDEYKDKDFKFSFEH